MTLTFRQLLDRLYIWTEAVDGGIDGDTDRINPPDVLPGSWARSSPRYNLRYQTGSLLQIMYNKIRELSRANTHIYITLIYVGIMASDDPPAIFRVLVVGLSIIGLTVSRVGHSTMFS